MLIYAHRGASFDFPEHSLPAYQAAIAQGADGFECDIRLTKDLEIICWHDSDTFRMTGQKFRISQSALSELDFAQVLKFETLLELAIENKKNLAVETKHPVATGGLIEKKLLELLAKRQEAIQTSGIWITIMSFSSFAVNRVANSPFSGVYLMDHRIPGNNPSAKILGPGLELIKQTPQFVARAHNQGKKVFVWTVNEPKDVRLCNDLGVDVIMSDNPALAREALG